MSRVAIILLNYYSADDTLTCLASLAKLSYEDFRVIVVDNASQDDSVGRIRVEYPQITLIESPVNRGFSGGNNLGIQEALNDPTISHVWILNNDTTVERDALSALMAEALQHPNALMGSVVLYPDGEFQRVGNRIEPVRGALKHYSQKEVEAHNKVESLTGCSMLIPRRVFEMVGLWDESYFLYFEDNDFCLRAKRAGFSCRVALRSRVFHREGASTGKNQFLVTYYYQRNRLFLIQRFCDPQVQRRVAWYTRFRLFRSTIKTLFLKSVDAHQHHRAFRLAVDDFEAGVSGKCRHTI